MDRSKSRGEIQGQEAIEADHKKKVEALERRAPPSNASLRPRKQSLA